MAGRKYLLTDHISSCFLSSSDYLIFEILNVLDSKRLLDTTRRTMAGGFATVAQNGGLCAPAVGAKPMPDCAVASDGGLQYRSVIDNEPHNLLTDIGSIQ